MYEDVATPETATAETAQEMAPPSDYQGAVSSDSVVTEETVVWTIWEKPFDQYTPTEGYLFLLFCLAMICFFYRIFRKGIF